MQILENYEAEVRLPPTARRRAKPAVVYATITREGLGPYSIDQVRTESGRPFSPHDPVLPVIVEQLRSGFVADDIELQLGMAA